MGVLRKFGFVKTNSLEDYLAGELSKIRNRIHAKDNSIYDPEDAEQLKFT